MATQFEIEWTDGRVSSGFTTREAAAEYAIESASWVSGRYTVSDDLVHVYDAEGRIGEIQEVRS